MSTTTMPHARLSALPLMTLTACVRVSTFLERVGARLLDGIAEPSGPQRRARGDRGQATTEYALVLLAAALVALLVIAWASAGGGAARISRLFNRVIDAVIDRV